MYWAYHGTPRKEPIPCACVGLSSSKWIHTTGCRSPCSILNEGVSTCRSGCVILQASRWTIQRVGEVAWRPGMWIDDLLGTRKSVPTDSESAECKGLPERRVCVYVCFYLLEGSRVHGSRVVSVCAWGSGSVSAAGFGCVSLRVWLVKMPAAEESDDSESLLGRLSV